MAQELQSGDKSHEQNVKISVESILGGKVKMKKVKKTVEDLRKELFCNIILSLEAADTRAYLLQDEFAIDLSSYSELYDTVIDGLLEFCFNDAQRKFISFYIYDRIDPETTQIVPIHQPDGTMLILDTPGALYDYIQLYK